MKFVYAAVVLFFISNYLSAQKTLLLEKIGTSRKYYYHADDRIKLRTAESDRLIKGTVIRVSDSTLFISTEPHPVPVSDIASVYRQFKFPRKLAIKLGEAAVVYFLIISINNLINHEQVFTPYTYIITGSCIAGGLISFSLSQQRCRIGLRWKLKILDMAVR